MRVSRRFGSAIAVAALAALAACGDGPVDPPMPTPTPTPPPCTRNLVLEDSGPVPASTLVSLRFGTTATSRIDAILDWTFSDSPMGLYVVADDGRCDLDEFNARSCDFLGRSEPSAAKPKRLSVPAAPAGDYRLLIANFADRDESASLQVFESRGSCDPISSAAATSAPSGEPLRVRSIGR